MTTRSVRARRRRALRLLALALGAAGATLGVAPAQAADPPDCPASNPPNSLSLSGGTPQSARLGAPFAEPFQVMLTNTDGCPVTTPVAGVAITFAAPAGGPSGTFASSGSNATLVGTNATGTATAPLFTANSLPGSYFLTASSAFGSVSFSLANAASGVPATITPVSPASESAPVSTRYARPLQARVLDANGTPVTGAEVSFSLGSDGGGSPAGATGSEASSAGASFDGGQSQATALSNSAGIATSPMLTADSVAGRFSASATTAGITEPATFPLDNLAGKPPVLKRIGKQRLTATVDRRYGRRLQVRLTSPSGSALQGQTVTFTLGSGGGAAGAGSSNAGSAGATFIGGTAQAVETTNAAGIATSPRFEANTTAGSFTATASVTGIHAVAGFALDNLAGAATTVSAGAAAAESTAVGSRFPIPLAVTVTDKHANPVAGVLVTFSAPTHGASGTFARTHAYLVRVHTNTAGIAVAPAFTAGSTAGGYVVKASVRGAGPAGFALVNQSPGQ